MDELKDKDAHKRSEEGGQRAVTIGFDESSKCWKVTWFTRRPDGTWKTHFAYRRREQTARAYAAQKELELGAEGNQSPEADLAWGGMVEGVPMLSDEFWALLLAGGALQVCLHPNNEDAQRALKAVASASAHAKQFMPAGAQNEGEMSPAELMRSMLQELTKAYPGLTEEERSAVEGEFAQLVRLRMKTA